MENIKEIIQKRIGEIKESIKNAYENGIKEYDYQPSDDVEEMIGYVEDFEFYTETELTYLLGKIRAFEEIQDKMKPDALVCSYCSHPADPKQTEGDWCPVCSPNGSGNKGIFNWEQAKVKPAKKGYQVIQPDIDDIHDWVIFPSDAEAREWIDFVVQEQGLENDEGFTIKEVFITKGES